MNSSFEEKFRWGCRQYKARLVTRVFSQSYGMDYEKRFSSVAKIVTVRTIFALGASMNWKLWQLDVKTLFFMENWIMKCLWIFQKDMSLCSTLIMFADLRNRCIALNNSPRAWYGRVTQYFIFCGFKVSDADSSLFIKLEPNVNVMVLLYVDDMIITGNNDAEISMLKNDLDSIPDEEFGGSELFSWSGS